MLKSWVEPIAAIIICCAIPFAGAQNNACDTILTTPACSYTALNGDCTVTINRFNPLAPPTIYAHRNSHISLNLLYPSPFEKLSLDLKSATAQVPPDQFANGFASLTTALGSLEIVLPGEVKGPAAARVEVAPPSVQKILSDQAKLLSDIKGYNFIQPADDALMKIRSVEQPMPIGLCEPGKAAALQPMELRPWLNTAQWRNLVSGGLKTAIDGLSTHVLDFQGRINELDDGIKRAAPTADQLVMLNKNQDTLKTAVSTLEDPKKKFQALKEEIDKIPDHETAPPMVIRDLQPTDKNYQIEVWNLNAVNKLSPVTKRVSGATYTEPDAALFAGLSDVSSKQVVVAVTVQYESSPRYEISAGVLVPFTPFHSYTAAQTETAAAPVVQQNLTYTVIPVANINFLLGHELIARRQRLAFFGTVAVGYSTPTNSAAFGVGPSISWRSVVFSPLVSFVRDTQLSGGFTVGGLLGTGTTPAAAPLTTNVWEVKPSFGLSLRIPLSGSTQ